MARATIAVASDHAGFDLKDIPERGVIVCHNDDADVAAFGVRLIGLQSARDALRVFLATGFESGRQVGRVGKLSGKRTP